MAARIGGHDGGFDPRRHPREDTETSDPRPWERRRTMGPSLEEGHRHHGARGVDFHRGDEGSVRASDIRVQSVRAEPSSRAPGNSRANSPTGPRGHDVGAHPRAETPSSRSKERTDCDGDVRMPCEINGKRAESPPAAGAVVEATAVNDVPSACPTVSDSGSGSSPPCSPGKEGSGRSEPAQATHPAVERLGGPLCPAPASNRGAGTSAHPLPTAASEAGGCDVDRHRQPGRTAPPHTPDETTGRPEGVVLDK